MAVSSAGMLAVIVDGDVGQVGRWKNGRWGVGNGRFYIASLITNRAMARTDTPRLNVSFCPAKELQRGINTTLVRTLHNFC